MVPKLSGGSKMRRKLVCVTWDFGLEFSRCYFTLFFGESAAECEYAVHLTDVKNYRYIGYSWFYKIARFLSFEGKKTGSNSSIFSSNSI